MEKPRRKGRVNVRVVRPPRLPDPWEVRQQSQDLFAWPLFTVLGFFYFAKAGWWLADQLLALLAAAHVWPEAHELLRVGCRVIWLLVTALVTFLVVRAVWRRSRQGA